MAKPFQVSVFDRYSERTSHPDNALPTGPRLSSLPADHPNQSEFVAAGSSAQFPPRNVPQSPLPGVTTRYNTAEAVQRG